MKMLRNENEIQGRRVREICYNGCPHGHQISSLKSNLKSYLLTGRFNLFIVQLDEVENIEPTMSWMK
jgi:hypothetical protein